MKINFVGDIGVFRKYEDLNIDPFNEVSLPDSDLNVGNFEFVVAKDKKKLFYDVQDQYSCSTFFLRSLQVEKFNALGLANNHVLDYGLDGTMDTITILKNKGIEVFGFSNSKGYSLGSFKINGIKTGIIACVKNGRWSKEKFGYGPDTYNVSQICTVIEKVRNQFDHIIIFPHWGTELVEIPNIEDTRNAKIFIDSGATAIIGHHPHVCQGIEVYNGGLIAYSLGSFIYIHEDELGYSATNTKRLISICLNIELSKEKLVGYESYYYQYNQQKKVPELINNERIKNYSQFLNENIYNRKIYNNQLTTILFRREFNSFFIRFKKDPIKTIINYGKYILIKVVRKMRFLK